MPGRSITQLLAEWNQGSRLALDELTPQVYRELHMLARKYLSRGRPNQTLQPTALINEAYLRLIDQSQPVHFENRSHFFGIAARLMRVVLVDYARAHYAAKRGSGTAPTVMLEETAALAPSAPDVLQLDDALRQLANVDERKANVIELRFFGCFNEPLDQYISLRVISDKQFIVITREEGKIVCHSSSCQPVVGRTVPVSDKPFQ